MLWIRYRHNRKSAGEIEGKLRIGK